MVSDHWIGDQTGVGVLEADELASWRAGELVI